MNPDQLAKMIREVVDKAKRDFIYYPNDGGLKLLLALADALDQTESAKHVRDRADAKAKETGK